MDAGGDYMVTKFITPDYIRAEELKDIRKKLGLTQKEFAELIGVSKPTIERWETSEKINGPIVLLSQMLTKEYVDELKVPEKILPIRMWYMYKNKKCTLIDVDEVKKQLVIKNYIDNIQFIAFGDNKNPTYEDYENFLETRCFSKDRDKMKLVLEDLGLPFYDPLMIIEKTEGRMAEDDFWIKVEK